MRELSCPGADVRLRKKNGRISSAIVSVSMVVIESSPHLLTVFRDISDIKQATAMIRSLAFYDPLTQLPNRRLLMGKRCRERALPAIRMGLAVPRFGPLQVYK